MSINASTAFSVAIDSVKLRTDLTEKQKNEIVSLLHNAAQRDWFVHWDKEKIIQALMDYKDRTGRAPTVTNLCETGMPKSVTIQTHCGMKASLFLKQLFPEQRRTREKIIETRNPFGLETQEQWIDCFKKQYEKQSSNGRVSSRSYDINRDSGMPSWHTIAIHIGVRSWVELKEMANIKDEYITNKQAIGIQVRVKCVRSPYIDMLKEQNDRRERLINEIVKKEAT